MYPDQFQLEKMIELLGSQSTIDRLKRGDAPADIVAGWSGDLDKFRANAREVSPVPLKRDDGKRPNTGAVWTPQGVARLEQRQRQCVGAAHCAAEAAEFDVVALLTTVNRTHERVAMHAVRESLLEMQAAAAGLPLVKVPIPSPCPNETYEQAMSEAMARARAKESGMLFSAISFWRIFAPIGKSSSQPAG